jgi:hypothetical protein
VLGLAAWSRVTAHDDPFVTDGLTGYQSVADATHRGDDGRAPVPGDGIGGQDDTGGGRGDHALDDHRHAAVRAVAGRRVGRDASRTCAGNASIRRRGELVCRYVEDRLIHASVGSLRAVLGDAAGADGEWSGAKLVGGGAQ